MTTKDFPMTCTAGEWQQSIGAENFDLDNAECWLCYEGFYQNQQVVVRACNEIGDVVEVVHTACAKREKSE